MTHACLMLRRYLNARMPECLQTLAAHDSCTPPCTHARGTMFVGAPQRCGRRGAHAVAMLRRSHRRKAACSEALSAVRTSVCARLRGALMCIYIYIYIYIYI